MYKTNISNHLNMYLKSAKEYIFSGMYNHKHGYLHVTTQTFDKKLN